MLAGIIKSKIASQRLYHSLRAFSMRFRWKQSQMEQGAMFVEFALTLPLFILMLYGIFEFSMLICVNHVVQDAVNRETRQLIVDRTLNPLDVSASEGSVEDALKQMLPDKPLYRNFRKPENITLDSPVDSTGSTMVRIIVQGDTGLHLLRLIGLETIKISGSAALPYVANYPEV